MLFRSPHGFATPAQPAAQPVPLKWRFARLGADATPIGGGPIDFDFREDCLHNPRAIYVMACLPLPARSRAINTKSPTTLRLFATAPELRADRASSVFDVAVA